MQRGDRYVTGGGGVGLYVGESLGCEWVAYDPATFRGMCGAFDRAAEKRLEARQLAIMGRTPARLDEPFVERLADNAQVKA